MTASSGESITWVGAGVRARVRARDPQGDDGVERREHHRAVGARPGQKPLEDEGGGRLLGTVEVRLELAWARVKVGGVRWGRG